MSATRGTVSESFDLNFLFKSSVFKASSVAIVLVCEIPLFF